MNNDSMAHAIRLIMMDEGVSVKEDIVQKILTQMVGNFGAETIQRVSAEYDALPIGGKRAVTTGCRLDDEGFRFTNGGLSNAEDEIYYTISPELSEVLDWIVGCSLEN